jgi:hypothetical protein
MQEMVAGASKPTAQIRAFYTANRDRFRSPETFHAVHIVKHVNEGQDEAEAPPVAEVVVRATPGAATVQSIREHPHQRT